MAGAPGHHTVTGQAKVYWGEGALSSEPFFQLKGHPGGAMSSYLGRRVVHTSMTADRHVTITLAPQAGPTAPPAARPTAAAA